ncbi:MAG: bifunctional diaminohydroxyphosphoribosylaminopyrimidine deaminase/5-amino-6-(5-phosphoribosylamino)uracil reductase RibD [Planctomycetota bacterium]
MSLERGLVGCERDRARVMLDRAARAGFRALGRVEPGVMVGCVLVTRTGEVVVAHHERFGAPHAEANALALCRARGIDASGAEVFVTLEPCAHTGKTPPCADALIEAGVGKVVCARRDPNRVASGGAERLRSAGIDTCFTDASANAVALSDAFVKRVTTGLPWVVVKWAQTLDGKLAARSGHSQWVSNDRSRRAVHRLRGRIDAVLTGIGTVKADDPMLTARGVTVRRVARRGVIDEGLELPTDCALVRSSGESPVTVVTTAESVGDQAGGARAEALRALGVEVLEAPSCLGGLVDLRAALAMLVDRHQIANLMVEAGSGLVSAFLEAQLADELLVYVAPKLLGDSEAMSAVTGRCAERMDEAVQLSLRSLRKMGDDLELRYQLG